MQIYWNVLALSLTAWISVVGLLILRRRKQKKYSALWINIAWILLCVRLLIPIQILPQGVVLGIPNLWETITSNVSSEDWNRQDGNEEENHLIVHRKNDLSGENVNPVIVDSDNTANSQDNMTNSSEHAQAKENSVESNEADQVSTVKLRSVKYQLKEYLLKKLFQITFLLWIAGMLVLAGWHLFTYFLFLHRVNRGKTSCGIEGQQLLLDQIAKSLGIRAKIPCFFYHEINSPMLIGIIKPSVLLPRFDYTEEEMEVILKHELTHYINHDMRKKLLFLLARIVYWFCPAVYLMGKYAGKDMELLCDEVVVRNQTTDYRKCYGMAILRTVANGQQERTDSLAACLSKGKTEMKERIQKILSFNTRKRGVGIAGISIAMILLVSSCFIEAVTVKNTKAASADHTEAMLQETAKKAAEVPLQQEKLVASQTQDVKQLTRIVLLGLQTWEDGTAYPDCILLLTVDRPNQEFIVTSVSRNLCVMDEFGEQSKLMHVYAKDTEEFYQYFAEKLNVRIDGVMTISMNDFETAMDDLGGAQIQLTESEAEYLNHTNFISKAENRCVKAGLQQMNGNQLLGYARVRYVPAADGEKGEWGRSYRQHQILESLFQQFKQSDAASLISCMNKLSEEVQMSFSIDELKNLVQSATNTDWNLVTETFPAEEDTKVIQQTMLDSNSQKQYLFQKVTD